jgi:hypothetical protein
MPRIPVIDARVATGVQKRVARQTAERTVERVARRYQRGEGEYGEKRRNFHTMGIKVDYRGSNIRAHATAHPERRRALRKLKDDCIA